MGENFQKSLQNFPKNVSVFLYFLDTGRKFKISNYPKRAKKIFHENITLKLSTDVDPSFEKKKIVQKIGKISFCFSWEFYFVDLRSSTEDLFI